MTQCIVDLLKYKNNSLPSMIHDSRSDTGYIYHVLFYNSRIPVHGLILKSVGIHTVYNYYFPVGSLCLRIDIRSLISVFRFVIYYMSFYVPCLHVNSNLNNIATILYNILT